MILLLYCSLSGYCQTKQDTTKSLKEVVITPYFSQQPLLRSTGAVGVLDDAAIKQQPPQSFVAAMNTIAGIRMEERSPGSYRLSIRGSLLRSPFGIRNVKIYFDEFPLTDAGGNSYLNALDIAAAGNIQILKGPQSSIYGANSGGVILISSPQLKDDSTSAILSTTGGSFGLYRENAALARKWKNYQINISEAYQRSDGYRNHSRMERKYFQIQQQLDYSTTANIRALLFYSDLHYETPGGLTAAQYEMDPQLSRPAAGNFRSAIEQQAGIYSKTGFGGIMNSWQINSHFKQIIALFSSYTDFRNPFISNYEHRKEFSLGLRSYIAYEKKSTDVTWQFNLGIESESTKTDFSNADNNYGNPAALQSADKLKAATNFAFAHLNIDISSKLLVELSASGNLYAYTYESLYPDTIPKKRNRFDPQLMPRIALSYLFTPQLSLRASISKGYSPPTQAEIRASDNVINVNLQPEGGWNYETGLRYQSTGNRLLIDVTGFYYHLNNAIVRRLNDDDTDYFINAGGTRQWGLETSLSLWVVPQRNSSFIRGLQLKSAYTLSHFKFDDYIDRNINLSGKALTGVPENTIVSSLEFLFPQHLSFFLQHSYTSRIPLTDANTVYASSYHLVQTRIGWKNLSIGNLSLEIFAGGDNLLNQKYSLGNDLNAAGGRYFNAAATRNFYAGLALNFKRKK